MNTYPLWHPFEPFPGQRSEILMLVKGKGCRVWDEEGNEYIDATGGLWSVQCGLGHPDIIAAITKQMERLSYGTLFLGRSNEPALMLARELVALAPAPLPWVYLTGSGSEAVEVAIKLARLHHFLQGRGETREIVYLDQAYHGTFFSSMAVSEIFDMKDCIGTVDRGVSSIPTPNPDHCPQSTSYTDYALTCARALEDRIEQRNGAVAAFILEPVLASAGVIIPPLQYLRAIQRTCHKHGVLLILDEVTTGFGRTGRWFASEHFSLKSDILLLGKGINSGYLPLGAVLFSDSVAQTLLHQGTSIGHGSSHNGNPACAAAALATLHVMRSESLVQQAAESGRYFRHRLEGLRCQAAVKDIRSLGLMLGIAFRQTDGTAATCSQIRALNRALQNRGILAYPGPSSLIFLPALTIERQDIDFVVDGLRSVIGTAMPQA